MLIIRIKLATQTLASAISHNSIAEDYGVHSQCAQGEQSTHRYLLTSLKLDTPYHIKWHAQYDDIECHVRGSDGNPVGLQINTLIRKQSIHVVSLGLRVTLKRKTQKCSNKP